MEHFFEGIEGWFHWSSGYDEAIRTAPDTPSTIVELGCWKGRSTAYLAVEVLRSGKPITIVVVDWFVASFPEHPPEQRGAMLPTFQANLAPVREALGERLVILSGHTHEVARTFVAPAPVWAVCVDAGHDYASVCGDLDGWWPHLAPGGLMLGDDYAPAWPEVIRAVDDFFGMLGLPVERHEGLNHYPHFRVWKPNAPGDDLPGASVER